MHAVRSLAGNLNYYTGIKTTVQLNIFICLLCIFCICCIQEIFLKCDGVRTATFADDTALLANGVSIEAATYNQQLDTSLDEQTMAHQAE